jgi:hypothetical protein
VARSSTNEKNAQAYKAYIATNKSGQLALLERVIVLDASPTIIDLDADLRSEVYWAAGREQHSAFLDRLEGWWFRRVLQQLASPTSQRIASVEVDLAMTDLREQFRHDALPIDDDLLDFDLDEATAIAHQASTFVQQIDLIGAGKRRVAAAIRDYYRAFEQRSRWVRDRLVFQAELGRYERRLLEEWEIVFEAMRDELGDAAAEDAKANAARSVLAWAERSSFPIRSSVTEPFVTRGSLHMLADEARLGWHPEFRERLAALLAPNGASA